VGAIDQRLAPGFVTDTRMEGEAAVGGRSTHHNASFQVFEDDAERTRLVWIADVLPHEAAPPIEEMMEQGARVMQGTLGVVGVRG